MPNGVIGNSESAYKLADIIPLTVDAIEENLKNISFEKKFDLTKPVIEIIFYGNRSVGSFSYFFQMDGYDSLDDFNNQGPVGL